MALCCLSCVGMSFHPAVAIGEPSDKGIPIKGNLWYTRSWGDNLFMGAGVGAGFRMSSYDLQNSGWKGQSSMQYSAHAGKWLTPVWGVQANVHGGHVSHFDAGYIVLSADCLLDLSTLIKGYDEQRLFSVVPLVGVGGAFSNHEHSRSLSFTYGLQGRFNVHRHVDVFAEFRGDLFSDAILNSSLNSFTNIFGLQIGVSYKLRGKEFWWSTFDAHREDVAGLNEKINELYARIAELEKQEQARMKEGEPADSLKTYYKEPVRKSFYIYIRFGEFSSYLTPKEKKNIENIGEWMKGEPDFRIKVLAFSDNMGDKKFDNELRRKRSEVIRDVLVNDYRIAPDRITVASPEDEGYENKTDCSAMIEFMVEE